MNVNNVFIESVDNISTIKVCGEIQNPYVDMKINSHIVSAITQNPNMHILLSIADNKKQLPLCFWIEQADTFAVKIKLVKIALVVHSNLLDPIIETIYINRGIHCRIFTEISEAFQYLKNIPV